MIDINNISREMIQCYKDVFGRSIIKILLYGSYARGDNNDESDIDYVAIVHGDRVELQTKLEALWDSSALIGLKYDVVVSPYIIPEDEYEKRKATLPYYMNIQKEGIEIG